MLKQCTLPFLLLLSAACGIGYPSYAADTTPAAPVTTAPTALSLQDCVALAQKNAVNILLGKNTVITAKTSVTQAKSAYFPQVGVNYNAFNYTAGTTANPQNQTGTQLVVTQNFWDGGLREANVRGSKAGVVVATKTLERTQQSVTYSVTGNYFNVLRNKKLVDVSIDTVKYLHDELDQVQAQIKVGTAAKYTELPINASLENAKVDLIAAQNNVRTALMILQQSMGMIPQSAFDVKDFTLPIADNTDTVDVYLASAMRNRPDIDQTHASVQLAKATVSTAKINLFPRPVIAGTYDQPIMNSGQQKSLSITGGIAFSIFSGGSNQAALKQAKASLDSANVQSAQVAKDIEADIQIAYLAMTSAYQRLSASDLSQQAAQSNYNAQLEVNKQGLGIPLDLLNAQVQLTTAKSTAVKAKYDYYSALAQLEYAMGKQGGLYAN